MKKILVEIYLPSTFQVFDVILPKKIYVHEAIKLISNMMNKLSNGTFVANEETILCNRDSGEILGTNKTIEELALRNGAGR